MHLLSSPSIQTMSSKRSVTVHSDASYYSQPTRQLNTQPQILLSPSAPHQQLFSQQSERYLLMRQAFSYQKDENNYDYRKKEGTHNNVSLQQSITSERFNKSKRTFTEHTQRTSAISSVCVQEEDQEGIDRVTDLLEELKSGSISAQRVFPRGISEKLDAKLQKQPSKDEDADDDEIATNAMEQSTFRGQSDVKSYMQSLLFRSKRNSISELESPEDGDYCYNSTSNSSGWETTVRDHQCSSSIPSRRQQINQGCFQQPITYSITQQTQPLNPQQCPSYPPQQPQQPQRKDANYLLNQKLGFTQRTSQQLSSQQLLTKQSPLNQQSQLVSVLASQNNLKQPTQAIPQDILKEKGASITNVVNGNYLCTKENSNLRTKLENHQKEVQLADQKGNNGLPPPPPPSQNRLNSLQTEVKNRTNSLFFESSKEDVQNSFSSTKSVERKRKIFESQIVGVGLLQGAPMTRNGSHIASNMKEHNARQSMKNNNNSKEEIQLANEFETSTIEEKQQDIFRKQQMPLHQFNRQPATFHPFSLHSINSQNINVNPAANSANNNCVNSSSFNLADNSIFSSNQIANPNNISSMSSLLDELSFLRQTTHSPAQIPPIIQKSQGLLPNQRNPSQFLDSNKQLCYIDSKQQLRNDLAKRRQRQDHHDENSENKENILSSGMQKPPTLSAKSQGNESILILKNTNYQVHNQDQQQYNSYQQQQQQQHHQQVNFQSLNNNNNNVGKPINPQKISQTPMKTLNLLTIARKKGIFYTTTDKKSLMAPLSKLL